MARIRSIHPAILTDEAFMTLTVERPLAIALLIGLWMEADDAGTFEWKPLTLKARILAAASDDIADLLAALVRNHFVRSFELNGRQYGVIRNFVKFQRPKAPIDSHPFNDETRAYAGFVEGKRPNAGTGRPSSQATSEPLQNSPETPSEITPLMKEEGGRKEKEREKEEKRKRVQAQFDADFDLFWSIWPNKVGKLAAEKAFAKVAGELAQIISGVERYIRDKPPDREWLNPATFLNGHRWRDQPASVVPFAARAGPSPPRTNLHMEAILESKRNDEAGITVHIPGM